ncbi:hypothetical protein NBRGN_057_00850 [Nocardia brasiliensis NBRC 14402]|uniref:hypothetical protein n=1 Tax=Nocardia brasiliensis TaxID=37326 RepID=UPI0002D71320|nr:hypothetical protein [Nocardia brasiliensis]ASF11514.1 hypothetical protein CEQ30_33935 [Nocardia brasiliensis]GAJ82581.1 hypothetical protein NBRGN_057_00850 [Nocardia brasiliensis NBRC 14402]SUB09715.1 Uncharacterised protein [Nocardia brasiliensis]
MSAPGRLSVVDEIFLRTHRGLGTPIALQGLWRTADRIEPELLRRIHATLRTGPLGRRVVRPRVPGARRAWRATTRAHPLAWHEQPIPRSALFTWADAQGDDLDPETGPGWRLSATALADGGSVVALTCSHALADGRALALAVDDALGGTELPAGAPVPGSDWADARRQWFTVVRGTVRALRRGIPARPLVAPDRADAPSGAAAAHSAVLQCAVADWDRTAEVHGGTANSVFIWLIANTLWACGFPAAVIEASLPVDTRDEPRVDNDLAMTAIDVHRTDTPASIRAQARAAYERRMSSPGGMPEELLQVIPDRWAYALSRGAGERDILCSNIGTLPATLTTLGAHRCTGVAARAIHPGLTAGQLPRTRLSGYLCRIADDYVVALAGLDPVRIESNSALTDLASKTAAAIDLPVRTW